MALQSCHKQDAPQTKCSLCRTFALHLKSCRRQDDPQACPVESNSPLKLAFSCGPRYSITPGSQGQELCHSTGAKAVLKSRFAGRSSNEVVTKSSWFTLSEGAMPHKLANTLCEKLHQLGERVGLFCLAAPAVGRTAECFDSQI